MTFRRRLLVVSLVTLAVGLGALIVVGNVLLAARVGSETSSVLRARADALVATLVVDGGGIRIREAPNDQALDRQSWVLQGPRVLERPGAVDPAIDRAAVALGRFAREGEQDGPADTRLLVRRVPPGAARPVGAVVVATSQEPLERVQQEVLLGSLVLAALVLLAGGLAIRSAVDGALRPVARMTERAEEWSAHDLDQRFHLGPPTDELSALAATLDGLLERIASSRRHERRFADDAALELRSPLARLRARAELALAAEGPGADADRAAALALLLDQADAMAATIDTLLAVARREVDAEAGVDLAALVAELEDVTVLAAASVPRAEGEPEVVRRALAPLLDNARRHARTEVVVALSTAGDRVRVTVRDDGPGVDPRLGERAFDAGARGPDQPDDGGAGLGLALARRMARSCGGDVVLGDGPGGCVVLELPIAAGARARSTR